jgi:triosephosphate isomerase
MPHVFLSYVNSKSPRFKLAAQDCSIYGGFGARTGEISADILASIGVEYIIVGHSERRAHGDDVESVYAKMENAVRCNITPILCVSDDYESQITNRTEELLRRRRDAVILAYEPVSAIGTGVTPSIDDIRETITRLRSRYGVNSIAYGGSVTSDNAQDVMGINGISGALVGGASLKLRELSAILNPREFI